MAQACQIALYPPSHGAPDRSLLALIYNSEEELRFEAHLGTEQKQTVQVAPLLPQWKDEREREMGSGISYLTGQTHSEFFISLSIITLIQLNTHFYTLNIHLSFIIGPAAPHLSLCLSPSFFLFLPDGEHIVDLS